MKEFEHIFTSRDEWLYGEFKSRLIKELVVEHPKYHFDDSGQANPLHLSAYPHQRKTKVVPPSAGDVCPCCKRKVPMTAAQRKRKQRAKQKQRLDNGE